MDQTKILLGNLNVQHLIDGSGSMGNTMPNGKSRWQNVQETVTGLVTAFHEHDDDGCEIRIFRGKATPIAKMTPEQFREFIGKEQPMGGTTLGPVLAESLALAKSRYNEKQELIICYTDGEPSDPQAVIDAIIAAANAQDRDEQCAILFVQVGGDADATAFLKKLDDGLQAAGAKFDIVDTCTYEELEGMSLQEIADKAFND